MEDSWLLPVSCMCLAPNTDVVDESRLQREQMVLCGATGAKSGRSRLFATKDALLERNWLRAKPLVKFGAQAGQELKPPTPGPFSVSECPVTSHVASSELAGKVIVPWNDTGLPLGESSTN